MSRARLLELLKTKAYENKEVTLASGKKSNFYIDVKRVSLTSEGAFLMGKMLFELVREKFSETNAVGGMTLGADPLVSCVASYSFSQKHPLEAFIIRKEPKTYGLQKWIEGGQDLKPETPVVLLEDVVTSGGSSLKAVQRTQERGWKVLGICCVVDRQEGGSEKIHSETGLGLYSLFKKSDF